MNVLRFDIVLVSCALPRAQQMPHSKCHIGDEFTLKRLRAPRLRSYTKISELDVATLS